MAVPFTKRTESKELISHSSNKEKSSAQLVLFEPRSTSSRVRSCQTIYQRMHHRPRENWDECEPSNY